MTLRRLFVVATVAGIGLIACSVGAQDIKTSGEVDVEPARIIGLNSPYSGYGTVDLLDDGVLIIEAGGERWEIEGEDGDIEFGLRASESIGFQIDPKAYVLVERDGRAGIERVNSLPALDGLAGASVKLFTFADAAKAAENPTRRRAVFTISGPMAFRFDRKNQEVHLSARSEEYPEQFFELNARLGSAADEDGGEGGKFVGVRLYELAYASSCSAVCDNGTSCNITCSNEKAECWCSGNSPRCRCVSP